ncbi:hypothetical protein Q3G72_027729 [Acer saccharum]|nr:hypothetical protein Q3G72_027729 [Acer saccharum]
MFIRGISSLQIPWEETRLEENLPVIVTYSAETKATRSQTKRTSSGNVIYSGVLGRTRESTRRDGYGNSLPKRKERISSEHLHKTYSATLQSLTRKQAEGGGDQSTCEAMASEEDGSDSRYSHGLPTNELEDDATPNTADATLATADQTNALAGLQRFPPTNEEIA